ncbi:MAG: HAD-IIIA family hydrolase [Verrucomicrobiota bacterium]
MSALTIPQPAVFFDRDGVINQSPGAGYVLSWDDFHFRLGISEILQLVEDKEYKAIVVTSQRCIGKGLISEDEVEDIHDRMQAELAESGPNFEAIYTFTGQPTDADWAKPNPDMLYAAARDHHLDLEQSVLIGDRDRDIQMAINANLKDTIRIRGDAEVNVTPGHIVDDLPQAQAILDSIL